VLILALTSDTLRLGQLYDLADTRLSPSLSQVPGVAEVEVAGAAKQATRIQANQNALSSMGLSMDAIRNAITGLSANSPKGAMSDGKLTWILSANDQLSVGDSYEHTVIGVENSTPITLASVAKITTGQENAQQAGWANGKRAVLLFVRKQAAANVIKTVDQALALMPQLREFLPPGVTLSVISDRTQTIRASIDEVQLALAVSIALVVLVMFLFLRRGTPTAIAGVTVPLALAATFGVMWLCGYSLDNLSLMALTVSVGFVVDDAIVVIENIVRHLENGETGRQAALNGAREIGFTIVSMTVSLIAVFIPILFMGGLQGRLFHEFAVTLSAAIAVSAVISLTLTPSLCASYLRRDLPDHQPGRLEQWLERCFDAMQDVYRRGLDVTLRYAWLALIATVATIVLTVYLYITIPKGFFPTQDTGMLQGSIAAAQDVSFTSMSDKTVRIADVVLKDPDVKAAAYSVGGSRNAAASGRMFITLRSKEEGRSASSDEVVARLRPKLAKVEGAQLYLQPVQDLRFGGRSTRSQYIYALSSMDLDALYTWGPKLLEKLKSIPELTDVNSDLEQAGLQVNVVVNRDAASRLGLQPQTIDTALYNAFGQRLIATIYEKTNQYHIILEAIASDLKDPSVLERLNIQTPSGGSVPLSSIAKIEFGTTPISVQHQGQFTVINLSFNLVPGVALGDATALVNQAMLELHMPGSVIGSFGGTASQFASSANSMPILLLTALLVVYIVLGVLYESLIHPLTIVSTLPSAGIGALLALKLFNMELTLVALIGIILLIGIVKKNAILMIDFALHAERERGLSSREAIYEACLTRFRPIMMTTMAALFGAVPLAIGIGTGSELRQPLGVAIIGGLIVSQMLTLFTTPVIFLAFDRLSRRRRAKPHLPSTAVVAG
jgi:hydrophobe/amphiphile efflux-1 (HAE1) family protein